MGYFSNTSSSSEGFEVFGTISEEFQLNSGTASVQLRCPWAERYNVVKAVIEGGDNDQPIEFPDQLEGYGSRLVANSVRIEPMQTIFDVETGDQQRIKYKYALITISYQMLAPEISIESTNQYLTIFPANLYWGVNGSYMPLAQDEAPGVRLASFDITLSHPHMNLKVGSGKIQDYEGYVNSDTVHMKYNGVEYTFEPQTLLCTTPSIRSGVNLYGSGFNSVSLKLSYNPLTHNEFFNPLQNAPAGASDAKIESHKVKMYKRGTSTGGTNTYEQVLIYPEKEFKPLIEAFDIKGE